MRYLYLLLTTTAALLPAACGRDEPPAEHAGLYARVPAGSAYLFRQARPVDADALNLLLQQSAAGVAQALALIDESTAEDDELSGFIHFLRQLAKGQGAANGIGELEQITGLAINEPNLVYAHGIYPVFMLPVHDLERLQLRIDTLIEDLDITGRLMSVSVDGREIKSVRGDHLFRPYWHANQDYLTVTVLPATTAVQSLPAIFGDRYPEQPIAADFIAGLEQKHGYATGISGFLRPARLLDALLADTTALNTLMGLRLAAAQVVQPKSPAEALRDPVCTAELHRLVDKLSLISFGITEFSTRKLAQRTVLETGGRTLELLQGVVGKVPIDNTAGLFGDAMFGAGLTFDTAGLHNLLMESSGAITEHPFQCPYLTDLNTSANELRTAIDRPIIPLIGNLQGLALSIDAVEALDLQNPLAALGDLGAVMLLFTAKPELLLNTARMFSPALAGLDLAPGNPPQAVDLEQLPNTTGPLHLATGENVIGISLGDAGGNRLAQALAAGQGQNTGGHLLSTVTDLQAYRQIVRATLAHHLDDLPMNEEHASAQDAQRLREYLQSTTGAWSWMGKSHGNLRITDIGVIIDESIEILPPAAIAGGSLQ